MNARWHQIDFSYEGFEWIDAGNASMSIVAFVRKSVAARRAGGDPTSHRCPAAISWWAFLCAGLWREVLNSDAREYGGAGWGNLGGVESVPVSAHGRTDSLNLNIPPLATVMLRWEGHG